MMSAHAPPPLQRSLVHRYQSSPHADLGFMPRHCAPWCGQTQAQHAILVDENGGEHPLEPRALARYVKARSWIWPDRPLYFFSDLHADAPAFVRSLCAAGLVHQYGPGHLDFHVIDSVTGQPIVPRQDPATGHPIEPAQASATGQPIDPTQASAAGQPIDPAPASATGQPFNPAHDPATTSGQASSLTPRIGPRVVIGGDCFDKGPHNLALLDVLHRLRASGVELELLAGNHDLRALVGFAYLGRKEPLFAHLFLRMGRKSIPLLQEINDYARQHPTQGATPPKRMPSEAKLAKELFPGPSWWDEFPNAAKDVLRPAAIEKELRRIREKLQEFKQALANANMTLQDAYLAGLHFEALFLRPQSRFGWFFANMKVLTRHGSLLFVHAGVCDTTAKWLHEGGVAKVQARFEHLREHNLFQLYNGPIGNLFRTKYRVSDRPLSFEGVRALRSAGIHAIVHGHRNVRHGQRICIRSGMLNFECDASLDENTRRLESIPGLGCAVTVFLPQGRVLGLSSDAPFAKSLQLGRMAKLLTSRPLNPLAG